MKLPGENWRQVREKRRPPPQHTREQGLSMMEEDGPSKASRGSEQDVVEILSGDEVSPTPLMKASSFPIAERAR